MNLAYAALLLVVACVPTSLRGDKSLGRSSSCQKLPSGSVTLLQA